MINYESYCQIRLFHQQRGLSFNQIASELGIRPQTVAKYANLATFTRRCGTKRPSKLDPFKPAITRWLEHHPYSATQIYQRLRADEGYADGFSIVKAYVRAVRPVRHPAFLSLAFAPGEAAQVDKSIVSPMPFGGVSGWDFVCVPKRVSNLLRLQCLSAGCPVGTRGEIRALAHELKSPMPFGGVSGWDAKTALPVAHGDNLSPMPFGGVSGWD